MPKHLQKLSLFTTVIATAILVVALNPVGSFADNHDDPCTPNNNSFREGMDFDLCRAGSNPPPTFNAFFNFIQQGTTERFDERDYLKVTNLSTPNTGYATTAVAEDGDILEVSAYLHNDCRPDLNEGGDGPCVAENVKTFVTGLTREVVDGEPTFRTPARSRHNLNQTFTSSNAVPGSITDVDGITIRSADGERVRLEYVEDSAGLINHANQNVIYPLSASRMFNPSGGGTALTSVNRNGEFAEAGQWFGSDAYISYIVFWVRVVEEPEEEEPCVSLTFTDVVYNDNGTVDVSWIADPEEFSTPLDISREAGSGFALATSSTSVRIFNGNNESVFLFAVPGHEAACSQELPLEFPDEEDNICEELIIDRRTFDPRQNSNTFNVTDINPDDVSEPIRWQVTGDTSGIEAFFSNGDRRARFEGLGAENRVIVFVDDPDLAPGVCREEIVPEQVCISLDIEPDTVSAEGITELRAIVEPPEYELDLIWSSPENCGLFSDGQQNPARALQTDSRTVSFIGSGEGGACIDVRAADPADAISCNAQAEAEEEPTPEPPEVDFEDNLRKLVINGNYANPGETVEYQLIYDYQAFGGGQFSSTIFDDIGLRGAIVGNRGGGVIKLPNTEMGINLPPCNGNPNQTNCFEGSIFNADGVFLQNLTGTGQIIISYKGLVDSSISPELCQQISAGECGERLTNRAFTLPSEKTAFAEIVVLCPAFRSYGYGDLLLEEDFLYGIDTIGCDGRPNTEGVILTPEIPITPDVSLPGTGNAAPTRRPGHGECRTDEANKVLSNISSSLCELQSRVGERIENPLDSVKRSVALVTNNVNKRGTVRIKDGSTAELEQYGNVNNQNELVIYANKIVIDAITLDYDGPVTLIAENEIIVNGDVEYARDQNKTPLLVAITKNKATINANKFSGFFIMLPDDAGNFQPLNINPDPGAAFEVIGALIGTNFELRGNDINIYYDGGRLLLTEPSVLNDALDFIQGLTAGQ